MTLLEHTATRYALPLREGGSLPAIIETEDESLFVVKFRGAGQGARALIAELITGLLAAHLNFPIPDLALVHLDDTFGRTERDPEIQDILKGSRGVNVGLRYLEGALPYDPVAATAFISPDFAADLVWLDAFTTNIDRTPRNPNLLIQNRSVWLIDHGASLYFHHDWPGLDDERIQTAFTPIRDHVLLLLATPIGDADTRLSARLNETVFTEIVAQVPDALLMDTVEGREPPFPTAGANRAGYVRYLTGRLNGPRAFVAEAETARQHLTETPPSPLDYRR